MAADPTGPPSPTDAAAPHTGAARVTPDPPGPDEFRIDRLRAPEWVIAGASLLLLVSLFLFKWYALTDALGPAAKLSGLSTSFTGWDALTGVRWLVLVTGVCGLAMVYTQAVRRSPALPVSMTVVVLILATVCSLALINRVVINEPSGYATVDQRFGAFAGMFSAIALVLAAYASLRIDGIRPEDGPAEIETVTVGPGAPAASQ